jgi:hypothetical protein
MSSIAVQAQIVGYHGRAVNLLCMLDQQTGLILIGKELEANQRHQGALFVTNDAQDPQTAMRDELFEADHLRDAIALYFARDGSGRLAMVAATERHKPAHKIERDGYDERGARYRLADDVSNGNVAVLAIVWTIAQADLAQEGIDFCAEMAAMFATI